MFAIYRNGFISVSADEFSRGIRAAQWAENPELNLLKDITGTWLPFEKFLNGFMLLIWPDVLFAPRFTVFFTSAILIITIYFLTYYLFYSWIIAVLSTMFISFLPWFVWLSATPMLEIYYFAGFFAGMLFLIIWLREARNWYWLLAGFCFFLASGFHVQSWTYINLVNLFTLPFLIRFIKRREYSKLSKLVGYYIVSNTFIIAYGLLGFYFTGEIFYFLSSHTYYSRWFYNGYDIAASKKLLYYPNIIVRNASPVIWISFVVAILFLIRDKDRFWKLFPLLLAVTALLLNSIMNLLSGPPSAAPDRYSLFFVIVLSFYLAYATYQSFHFGWINFDKFFGIPIMILAVFLFMYATYWGINRIDDHDNEEFADAIGAGKTLNTLLLNNPGNYMVELDYWDYLAIDLTSGFYGNFLLDREQDLFDRNIPSMLSEDLDLCHTLVQDNLKYVVLKDGTLKSIAAEIKLLRLHSSIGSWTIFEVVPEGLCEQ